MRRAKNLITQIHDRPGFDESGVVPRLGPDVPQWFGETIGFWDGDALITWTSNIQGWISHGGFEFSNKLQSIEIYTPRKNASGALVGIKQEACSTTTRRSPSPSASCTPRQAARAQRRRSVRDHGMRPAELSRRRPYDADAAGQDVRVPRARHLRDAPGRRSGSAITRKAWSGRESRPVRFVLRSSASETQAAKRRRVGCGSRGCRCGGRLRAAAAHHSFAMYDDRKTYVMTGVVTRVDPNPNHLQIFFAPLNERAIKCCATTRASRSSGPWRWTRRRQLAREASASTVFRAARSSASACTRCATASGGGRGKSGLFKCPPTRRPRPASTATRRGRDVARRRELCPSRRTSGDRERLTGEPRQQRAPDGRLRRSHAGRPIDDHGDRPVAASSTGLSRRNFEPSAAAA